MLRCSIEYFCPIFGQPKNSEKKANSSLKAQIRFEPLKSTMDSSEFFDPESGLFEAELRWDFKLMI